MILSSTRQGLKGFHFSRPDEVELVEFPAQCGDVDELRVEDVIREEVVDDHHAITREVVLEMVPERNQK